MNDWQAVRQVKYLLQQAVWGDGSSVVFAPSSVIVTAGAHADALAQRRLPLALVRVGACQSDETFGGDFPEVQQQDVSVLLVVSVQGDRHGESSVVGAGRAGQNSSAGRGLLEIEEKALSALLHVDDDDGLRLALSASGAADVQHETALGSIATRELRFRGLVTPDRSYRALRAFTATGSSGSASGTFTLPATRFDTSHVILRRASGATPPSSATAGTGVTLSGDLPTTWSDVIAAGTYSYAAFLAYDEFGDGVNLRYSDALTQASVVVS